MQVDIFRPECGSDNIPTHAGGSDYYCLDCQHEFNEEDYQNE